MKTRLCDFIPLYERLSGRVEPLHTRSRETLLTILEVQGQSKSSLRKIIIVPDYPLLKITTSDLIVLPWGVRPNTWVPPQAPLGFGPTLWVKDPSNNIHVLKWDGSKFISDGLVLQYTEEDGWHFSNIVPPPEDPLEDPEEPFIDPVDSCSLNCIGRPTELGHIIVKTGGPNAYFEILKMDEHQDHLGRTSHYSFYVDWLDQKNITIQE